MKNYLLLIVFTCSQLFSFTQKPVIKNLVFEGAGIRGIAYCGAIQELELKEMMPSVERVGGTSAGAIVALTVALGYTGNEIEKIIASTNFKQFNDGKYLFAGGINRLNKYYGWYRGKAFEKWLDKLIKQKTSGADITFEELKQKGFKELYITGTCLNKQRLVVFSAATYPHMKIKDAVRISMSIPLYFEAVIIDSSGKVIKHPKNLTNLDVMADGGLTGNFPIHIFDEVCEPVNTLGFRIDSDNQIENDKTTRTIAAMPVNTLKQYVNALYNMIIENLNRHELNDDDWRRTVSISDGNIAPRIRKLAPNEVSLLIENGRRAMKGWAINNQP